MTILVFRAPGRLLLSWASGIFGFDYNCGLVQHLAFVEKAVEFLVRSCQRKVLAATFFAGFSYNN